MGKQGQRFYETTEVLEIIDRYYRMKKALGITVESPYGHLTADYDNLGMPRGSNISDPTGKHVEFIISERMARDYRSKIAFIDNSEQAVTKEREKIVLHWKLSGMKTKHIAELEDITERHVRRIINDIAQRMSEMSVMSVMSEMSVVS